MVLTYLSQICSVSLCSPCNVQTFTKNTIWQITSTFVQGANDGAVMRHLIVKITILYNVFVQ